MMGKLLRDESGAAMVLALAFMVLAVPLLTGSLALASALTTDSRVKNELARDQYGGLGAVEYVLYRLVHEEGYLEQLDAASEDVFTLEVGGQSLTVTVEKPYDSSLDPELSVPVSTGKWPQTSKTVEPDTAPPLTPTTVAYTITVENLSTWSHTLNKVHDELPAGFTYISGSTSGVTTDDPDGINESCNNDVCVQTLTWQMPSETTLLPGESLTLSFEALADVPEGVYCNEAWVEPGDRNNTSSGKTAMVTVGSPASQHCQGYAVEVAKTVDPAVVMAGADATFTYAIAVENIGTETVNMTRVRDLLPEGFAYVQGTTGGDVTADDPQAQMMGDNRQRLTWSFPTIQMAPGESRTLRFDAQAQLDPGKYWNEVWVSFDEYADPVYSWPTAPVKALSMIEITAEGQRPLVYAAVSYDGAVFTLEKLVLHR